jgi:2-polyprenyl-3-methyl-5-hydroxy-6-metoxy-1,4-benzoquinol methylase
VTDRDQTDCCGPPADPRVARRFDRSWTDWDDTEGFPEIVDVSAGLLDRLRDATLARPSLLEIGCGTGGLSVALLEMGARSVKGVDLSAASVDLARRRAAHAGFAEQASFEVGQGAAVHGEQHDWVVADRVLCCDANLDRMLEAVIGAARSRIAISVPESRGWRGLLNRPMWAAENVWDLLHQGCRGYVHDVRAIERRLASAGFRAHSSGHVGLWHVAVYSR